MGSLVCIFGPIVFCGSSWTVGRCESPIHQRSGREVALAPRRFFAMFEFVGLRAPQMPVGGAVDAGTATRRVVG